MKKLVLFGAGIGGCSAAISYMAGRREIKFFIDNDVKKQGTQILEIPVISIQEYLKKKEPDDELVISVSRGLIGQISKQLQEMGIKDFSVFDIRKIEIPAGKTRLLSYAQPGQMEDVILYHALLQEEKIFYIDIGSNDPYKDSVTKLLYDMGNACGIDIEPLEELSKLTEKERPRDICLNCGIGSRQSTMLLNVSGELSTFEEVDSTCEKREVQVRTLADVCDELVCDKSICFIKIDVEGYEEQVLRGADFKKYRPYILEIESIDAETKASTYSKWETYLLEQGYHFVYAWGVNRYYVANERADLDERFVGVSQLARMYQIHFMGREI